MTNFSTTQHTVNDGVQRLAVTGEVDIATADLLTDTITDLITAGHVAELIIDLDQVTFLDSTGINSLIRGHNLAVAFGIAYLVTNPHKMVRQVLDITGVLHLLTEQPQPSLLP
jgi:anti-sigma B factor antagonist